MNPYSRSKMVVSQYMNAIFWCVTAMMIARISPKALGPPFSNKDTIVHNLQHENANSLRALPIPQRFPIKVVVDLFGI